jgi:hypothetical protein
MSTITPTLFTQMELPSSSYDIENLSLEELDALLPELETKLQSLETPPIDEVVEQKFNNEWELIFGCLEEEYNSDLNTTKQVLYIYTAFENLLKELIGDENTKLFLRISKQCIDEKSFKYVNRLYSKVDEPFKKATIKLFFSILQNKFGKLKNHELKNNVKYLTTKYTKLKETCSILKELQIITF